jgi:hypothetical protein
LSEEAKSVAPFISFFPELHIEAFLANIDLEWINPLSSKPTLFRNNLISDLFGFNGIDLSLKARPNIDVLNYFYLLDVFSIQLNLNPLKVS